MDDARFAVDPDGLDTLSARLGELVSAMTGLDTTVSMYDPAELGADGKVAKTAEGFSAGWAANLQQLAADVTGLRDRLTGGAGAYRDTESQITAAAAPPGTA